MSKNFVGSFNTCSLHSRTATESEFMGSLFEEANKMFASSKSSRIAPILNCSSSLISALECE